MTRSGSHSDPSRGASSVQLRWQLRPERCRGERALSGELRRPTCSVDHSQPQLHRRYTFRSTSQLLPPETKSTGPDNARQVQHNPGNTGRPDFCHPTALGFAQQVGCSQMQLLVPFPAITDNIHEEDALAEMPVHSVVIASWNYWTAVKNSARHRSSCPFLEQELLRFPLFQPRGR